MQYLAEKWCEIEDFNFSSILFKCLNSADVNNLSNSYKAIKSFKFTLSNFLGFEELNNSDSNPLNKLK